jgi:hypothetical protein
LPPECRWLLLKERSMIRASLEHRLNGLHVYCRLRDLMIPPRQARTMAKAYEAVAHKLLYRTNAEIDKPWESIAKPEVRDQRSEVSTKTVC